jgi:hypothetical protein
MASRSEGKGPALCSFPSHQSLPLDDDEGVDRTLDSVRRCDTRRQVGAEEVGGRALKDNASAYAHLSVTSSLPGGAGPEATAVPASTHIAAIAVRSNVARSISPLPQRSLWYPAGQAG